MTDATYFGQALPPRIDEAPKEATLPPPQPLRAPVFIHDCVTPIGGETLLSLLMKKMMSEDQL